MNKRKIMGILLFVAILGLITWGGYKGGFSWGLARGYTTGYEAGLSSFPRLDIGEATFSDGENTVTLSDMVITGEQHIIDTIKDLPSMDNIIRKIK